MHTGSSARNTTWQRFLSHAAERQVSNRYTVKYRGQLYQIERSDVRSGMRGAKLRVEARLWTAPLRCVLTTATCACSRVSNRFEQPARSSHPPASGRVQRRARAAGWTGSGSSPRRHSARRSRLPMRPVELREPRQKERRAKSARRTSRLSAQSLRSGDSTEMISETERPSQPRGYRGSEPITPEPAPSYRLWARPLADALTVTRTPQIRLQEGTFSLCWRRGHFYFALTPFMEAPVNAR